MEETIKVNAYVGKDQFKSLFDRFLSYHGYMTKLVNKANNDLSGYLLRAEIPLKNIANVPKNNVYVAITFVPNNNIRNTPVFLKSVGINKVLIAGERKLKNYIKNGIELVSDSILNYFKKPSELTKEELKMFDNNEFNYNEFYNYIGAFENKTKNYYKDKNVVVFVV